MFVRGRLASGGVKTKSWISVGLSVAPIVLVACGSGRNYDNPPDIAPISAESSTSTVPASSTTLFVPSTAPTTLAPVTVRPTSPPEPPAPPQTPRPTEATVPTTPVATTGNTYTVQSGDTLFGISRRLGVTLDALLSANGMNQNSLITPSQALQIPVGGSAPPTDATTPATNATTPATNAPNPTSGGTVPPQATSPQVGPTTTFAAPPGAVTPSGASATCQGDNSSEANGTPIVFAPTNVLDHNPGTAWRCPVQPAGQTLTVTLSGPTHLTSLGMIGGYVKVDPLTGFDRFTQNHRARQVIWRFSDGTSVTQDLADSRGMQSIPVDVTTEWVSVEIVSTYPPSGPDPKQNVVVAEIQLIG